MYKKKYALFLFLSSFFLGSSLVATPKKKRKKRKRKAEEPQEEVENLQEVSTASSAQKVMATLGGLTALTATGFLGFTLLKETNFKNERINLLQNFKQKPKKYTASSPKSDSPMAIDHNDKEPTPQPLQPPPNVEENDDIKKDIFQPGEERTPTPPVENPALTELPKPNIGEVKVEIDDKT